MDLKYNKDAKLQYESNYPIHLVLNRKYYYFMLICNFDVDHRQIVVMRYVNI